MKTKIEARPAPKPWIWAPRWAFQLPPRSAIGQSKMLEPDSPLTLVLHQSNSMKANVMIYNGVKASLDRNTFSSSSLSFFLSPNFADDPNSNNELNQNSRSDPSPECWRIFSLDLDSVSWRGGGGWGGEKGTHWFLWSYYLGLGGLGPQNNSCVHWLLMHWPLLLL